MVLTALAVADYPAPQIVWRDDPPPTYLLIASLGDGVAVHGPPATGRPAGYQLTRPDWHTRARCFSAGADVFFGDEIEGQPILRPKVLARARAICRYCPVSRTCLTWALEHDERYGVWAGTSGRNRDAMQDRLRAGETIQDVVTQWLATL